MDYIWKFVWLMTVLFAVIFLYKQASRIISHERVRRRHIREAIRCRDQLLRISNGDVFPTDVLVDKLYRDALLALARADMLDDDTALEELNQAARKAAAIAGEKQLRLVKETAAERYTGLGVICLQNLFLVQDFGPDSPVLRSDIQQAMALAQAVRRVY